MSFFSYDSLSDIQSDLSAGAITCRQLVEQYLERIEAYRHLNCFLAVYAEEALQRANEIDRKWAERKAGRLAGMVLGLKDVLSYQDHNLQASSNILSGFIAQFTATAVQRVLDEDAIIIGRQNCDEFGMGSSNENSAFGPVRNVIDPERVSGGSSGGSAVAVQAGLCLASLGSDTGGSVRQPAAFCGVVGLKPTYARVSRYGLVAYASSFDCVGPITRSVEDAARLLEVMAGADQFDSTVSRQAVPPYLQLLSSSRPLRVAYFQEGIESEGVEPAIRQKTAEMLEILRSQGHTVDPVEFPLSAYILPTYYILTTAEASSNLSRFDGVRYGYRSPLANDLESLYTKSRTEGFGEEVRRRIMLGTFVLSASYYDAYYTKAQRVRRLIKEATDALFTRYDLLVSPVTPTTAFQIGEKSSQPLQMYLADIFTVHANVVGYPAISVPNGTDPAGLPIGFQLMAAPFQEADLLAVASRLMRVAG